MELIKAVMMQESGGRGSDPMQASECSFNTRYPNTPGAITDPEYSVNVGIQNLAASLAQAGVESPIDIERISLALQGYNYGNGYIRWALENYGGYSAQNAAEFSDMMAARLGWSRYGDRQYVSHVLRYYPISGAFMGGGQAMVEVALTPGWQCRRTALLDVVRLQLPGGVVRHLCKLVRRAVRLY